MAGNDEHPLLKPLFHLFTGALNYQEAGNKYLVPRDRGMTEWTQRYVLNCGMPNLPATISSTGCYILRFFEGEIEGSAFAFAAIYPYFAAIGFYIFIAQH